MPWVLARKWCFIFPSSSFNILQSREHKENHFTHFHANGLFWEVVSCIVVQQRNVHILSVGFVLAMLLYGGWEYWHTHARTDTQTDTHTLNINYPTYSIPFTYSMIKNKLSPCNNGLPNCLWTHTIHTHKSTHTHTQIGWGVVPGKWGQQQGKLEVFKDSLAVFHVVVMVHR